MLNVDASSRTVTCRAGHKLRLPLSAETIHVTCPECGDRFDVPLGLHRQQQTDQTHPEKVESGRSAWIALTLRCMRFALWPAIFGLTVYQVRQKPTWREFVEQWPSFRPSALLLWDALFVFVVTAFIVYMLFGVGGSATPPRTRLSTRRAKVTRSGRALRDGMRLVLLLAVLGIIACALGPMFGGPIFACGLCGIWEDNRRKFQRIKVGLLRLWARLPAFVRDYLTIAAVWFWYGLPAWIGWTIHLLAPRLWSDSFFLFCWVIGTTFLWSIAVGALISRRPQPDQPSR